MDAQVNAQHVIISLNWQRRSVLSSEVVPKVELVATDHAIHGIEIACLHKSTIKLNISTLMFVLGPPVQSLASSAAVPYEIAALTSMHFRSHLATPYLDLYLIFKNVPIAMSM